MELKYSINYTYLIKYPITYSMYLECNTEFEVLATKFNTFVVYVSYLSCIPSGKGIIRNFLNWVDLDPTNKLN